MWRTVYKLTKSFSDAKGPLKTAEALKAKVDKFKSFIPLLQCICNPGLRDRHWDKISDLAGFDIKPDETTSLSQMLTMNLQKFIEQLEEIGASASKEYSLEKAMIAMKKDWTELMFTFIPYRDTGVSILSSVDDIQVLLDDHIVKAQTMRGSPFIKPFEQEITAWEQKLISMQDILDEWLKVQASWLYLEPIFSSEDIIAQMPEEGSKFAAVDKTWRSMMANCLTDAHALVVTDQPNMLENLKHANFLLEEIQKGLNKYLEVKRLFFPRFFFLSNDELLEILSETKDPLRVQPHLKKCFEGIARLKFDDKKEIHGMISAEGEEVKFDTILVPADAKGMVEKWLDQVRVAMISSLRNVVDRSIVAYENTPRSKWVQEWTGQVVLCTSQIFWTKLVAEAIEKPNGLKDFLKLSNSQIDDIVELVRGKLSKATRTTLVCFCCSVFLFSLVSGCLDCTRCACARRRPAPD
jgi:dynein heavy chain